MKHYGQHGKKRAAQSRHGRRRRKSRTSGRSILVLRWLRRHWGCCLFLIAFFVWGFCWYERETLEQLPIFRSLGQRSEAYFGENGEQEEKKGSEEGNEQKEEREREEESGQGERNGWEEEKSQDGKKGQEENSQQREQAVGEKSSLKGEEVLPGLSEDGFVDLAPGDKVVYLTFDDGPCDSTGQLLDVLEELQVPATFFVTGQYFQQEDLLKQLEEIYRKGHGLGVHTYSHRYEEIYASVETFFRDYDRMAALVEQVTGKRNRLLRFPGGSNTGKNVKIRQALLEAAGERDLIYHDWNSFVGDTEGLEPDQMLERAVGGVLGHAKSVMLLHNGPDKDAVIDILPQIVEQLRAEGYRFALLDETVRPFQFASVE
ncbi:MAG: polysaccharide deacetylase [Lachnospiraceae bacterium]|nr:polysaccharide deacetylase [Lachnospiraceae bacterium]